MFRMVNAGSTAQNAIEAINSCVDQVRAQMVQAPNYIMTHASASYDLTAILNGIRTAFPNSQIHGSTSCLGALSGVGVMSSDGFGLAIIAIYDPEGDYGVGRRTIGDHPRDAAVQAFDMALDEAARPGQSPDLLWLSSAPGAEEEIIAGLQDIVGLNTIIIGGTSADNEIAGNWKQFDHTGLGDDEVLVSAMYPSVNVGTAFQNTYDPTPIRGRVTKASGRSIIEIDGQRAADVYREWTGRLLSSCSPDETTNILALSSLTPLGRNIGDVGGVDFYLLSHPETVTENGHITLFTDIMVGDELTLMVGTDTMLITRAGRVVEEARIVGEFAPDSMLGAIVVCCAGCMLKVRDDIRKIHKNIQSVLGDVPFIGTFTFGEQGRVLARENRHGNLMVSAVVFGKVK